MKKLVMALVGLVEVTEYVIPAKSKESFTFEGVIGGVTQDIYRMGYVNAEDDEIWWGGADWWLTQKRWLSGCKAAVSKPPFFYFKSSIL